MGKHAVQVVDSEVVQSIVGDASWANENLGGTWIDVGDKVVSVGFKYVDGEFQPLSPYPSWVWSNGEWHPPVPMPEPLDSHVLRWDESLLEWVQVKVPIIAVM